MLMIPSLCEHCYGYTWIYMTWTSAFISGEAGGSGRSRADQVPAICRSLDGVLYTTFACVPPYNVVQYVKT